ncbi:phosphotransferase family protein [Micromonospora cremea]|uniref:phosphotransferase family protein n=1 Tax=Micromonospora cremea TaxID=709881 RepID=UPI00135649A2|nr:aminoglycoside phosphotransferase family protein [Micromonospora cremea]
MRTPGGQAAYLKVTPAALGPTALAAARRELRFYRDVAPVTSVRTPRLLDCVDAEDVVVVLLEAAGEPEEAPSWTAGMWANLGRELATLHSMPLPTGTGWNRPDALLEVLANADLEEIRAFWAPVLPQLADLVSRRFELEDQIGALPPVFIHGDCHTDNIVHSAGSLVFCDWQAAGIGRAVSDLAFLSVRVTPAGVTVPRALVDTYLDGRPGERRALQRALLAEELAILVFLWPPFAAFNSQPGIAHVHRRARELTARWFETSARQDAG